MQRQRWHRTLRAAGLAVQFGVAPAFAQSAPATTPSTPPVTSPPPPAVHPPTGGPNSLPTGEPANVIAKGDGLRKAASPFTADQARSRPQQNPVRKESALTKDHDVCRQASADAD